MAVPLTEQEKDLIRRVYDTLGGLLPGFSPTAQQRRMIAAGANALADGGIAMIEAPTGVGKTVGYLVPGMVLSAMRDKRLVVATATAALQDQIASKDVQLVAKAMAAAGIDSPRWTVSKGRERYICLLRLEQQATAPDLFARDSNLETLDRLRNALRDGEWSGDRDSWPDTLDPALWRGVANSRHSCLASKCSQAARCPYFLASHQAEGSRVVIANHDLVLTSLARTDRSVFADFETNYYVFDEAHHLADKALGAFASRASDALDWTHDFPALLARAGASQFKKAAELEVKALAGILASLRVSFQALANGKNVHRFKFGEVPPQIRAGASQAKAILARLLDYLAQAEKATDSERLRIPLGSARGQIETAIDGWDAFSTPDQGKPRARWVEFDRDQWTAITSPFDAAPFLKRILWEPCQGAILTSATLAPLASFDASRGAIGLRDDERVTTLRLDSPFDYSRARLRIPRMASAPEDAAGHTVEVARQVRLIAAGADGGVLVLFASARQLREVVALLGEDLRQHILVQGEMPVNEILSRNRDLLNAGKRSIIFGLANFAEGTDLPGKLCTRVVIAKLPFPAPDEPLIAAASEWIERQGAHAFPIVMLPRAVIRFVQAVGRLMRSRTDWGEVIVLDRRLADKAYGRKMQAVIPMKSVVA